MPHKNDLSDRSDAQLVQAYVDNVQSWEMTEHVGAKNRLMDRRMEIVDELAARSGGTLQPLRRLLDHADPKVRHVAAIHFRTIDHAAFERTVRALAERQDHLGLQARQSLEIDAHFQKVGYPERRRERQGLQPIAPQVLWQSLNAPPPPMARSEIERLLTEAFAADVAAELLRITRPAIGLWPQRPQPGMPIAASRLGGIPYAPPKWSWPVAETEPMLFLGHISCAELNGLPGAEELPSSGTLAFFGDHDSVTGCLLTGAGASVFYWPDIDRLVPATTPVEPLKVFPLAALAFRAVIDLPHPFSRVVTGILAGEEQIVRYAELYRSVRHHGIPPEFRSYCGFGKLLGWPSLIQHEDLQDTAQVSGANGFRLLLQIDPYTNGEDSEGWGPGGSLYFLIRDKDLRKRRFDRCEYEMQFT
jgi:uncharacterized protein YwqG